MVGIILAGLCLWFSYDTISSKFINTNYINNTYNNNNVKLNQIIGNNDNSDR